MFRDLGKICRVAENKAFENMACYQLLTALQCCDPKWLFKILGYSS